MGDSISAITGRHVCAVAPSTQLREQIAARWMHDGLSSGAQVFWTEPPDGPVRRFTSAPGSPFAGALADGRLTILDVRDVVGVASAADIPTRLDVALNLTHEALAAQYSGVTIGIDVADAITVMPDVETQLRFESAWEEFTRHHPLSLLCLYGPELEPWHRDRGIAIHSREVSDPFASARVTGGGVCLDGEIDALNAGIFRDFLLAAATRDFPASDLVIDVGGLSFIDAVGVRVLIDFKAAIAPRTVRVVSPPRVLRRLLDVLRWDLDLRPTKAAAP